MGYDTRRRAQDGVRAGVSQTAVCDTGGSDPTASQKRMAPNHWSCSAPTCGRARASIYSPRTTTRARPTSSHPLNTRPLAWGIRGNPRSVRVVVATSPATTSGHRELRGRLSRCAEPVHVHWNHGISAALLGVLILLPAKQTEVEGLRGRTDIARGRVSQTTVRTGTRASED